MHTVILFKMAIVYLKDDEGNEKELKEIKKCVLKVLPDAELSLNPMRATITCRMQEAKEKKKEMQVQREREPKKENRRKQEVGR